MKRTIVILVILISSVSARAQNVVELANLWAIPRVHVLFNGYTISFTVKDINKALGFLARTGELTYGIRSNLNTGKDYYVELYPGYRTQYKDPLQPLLQKGVAAFLIRAGHAEIENAKHKRLKSVIIDAIPLVGEDVDIADIKFYDPRNNNMVFNGQMASGLYNKDLGID